MRSVEKTLKLGVNFFPTKHKSSHTRHFDDKETSDLDFLAHLASKNNIVSFSPVLHTPWKEQPPVVICVKALTLSEAQLP